MSGIWKIFMSIFDQEGHKSSKSTTLYAILSRILCDKFYMLFLCSHKFNPKNKINLINIYCFLFLKRVKRVLLFIFIWADPNYVIIIDWYFIFCIQKSSLGENWPNVSGRLTKTSTSDLWRSSPDSYSGEYGVSPVSGASSTMSGVGGAMKYVVHKQPLSLDRFFVHDVTPAEAAVSKIDNAFVLVCLNRFQQIVTVHTFQTESEQIKVVIW